MMIDVGRECLEEEEEEQEDDEPDTCPTGNALRCVVVSGASLSLSLSLSRSP
jgi:hypothetical protein